MSNEEESKSESLFESRFMSIVLMLCLIAMCALFIVIIWQIFGADASLEVLMYMGIGVGAGIVVTFGILVLVYNKKPGVRRNLLLGVTAISLILSLIISLILRFSIADKEVASWAFIDSSSIGLGVTTGLAITYLILAIFKSKLVYGKVDEDKVEFEEKIETELAKIDV